MFIVRTQVGQKKGAGEGVEGEENREGVKFAS